MAGPENSKSGRLTKFAGITSLTSFALAVMLIAIALRLRAHDGRETGLAFACSNTSFLLTVVSFLSGVRALCGARKARGLDVSIALAGVIFSGSLFFSGKIHHFGRVMTAREACIANLKQIDNAKATWALERERRHETNTITDIYATNAWPLPGHTLP